MILFNYFFFCSRLPNGLRFEDGLAVSTYFTGVVVCFILSTVYHDSATRNVYLALLTATGIGCGVFTLRPKFRRPEYRFTRFLMHAGLGASLFVPIIHGLSIFGWDELDGMMGLRSFFGLGLINFSGSAIYAVRIPERWFPRRFDLL